MPELIKISSAVKFSLYSGLAGSQISLIVVLTALRMSARLVRVQLFCSSLKSPERGFATIVLCVKN